MKAYKNISLARNNTESSFASSHNLFIIAPPQENCVALKFKNWSDAGTTIFQATRTAFGNLAQFDNQPTIARKVIPINKNLNVAKHCENILTIQTLPIWNGTHVLCRRRPSRRMFSRNIPTDRGNHCARLGRINPNCKRQTNS